MCLADYFITLVQVSRPLCVCTKASEEIFAIIFWILEEKLLVCGRVNFSEDHAASLILSNLHLMPEDVQYGRNVQHLLTALLKFVVVEGNMYISLNLLRYPISFIIQHSVICTPLLRKIDTFFPCIHRYVSFCTLWYTTALLNTVFDLISLNVGASLRHF